MRLFFDNQKATANAKRGNLNQINASTIAISGIGEIVLHNRQITQKNRPARTQNIFSHAQSSVRKHRKIKHIPIRLTHTSAGVLSINRIKGPNNQKILNTRSKGCISLSAACVCSKIANNTEAVVFNLISSFRQPTEGFFSSNVPNDTKILTT